MNKKVKNIDFYKNYIKKASGGGRAAEPLPERSGGNEAHCAEPCSTRPRSFASGRRPNEFL